MSWNDFFERKARAKYTDYMPKPEYSLRTGNNRDGYVYQLANGINWRFTEHFPDARVAQAFRMAQQEFADMSVELGERDPNSHLANIRIRKRNGDRLTEEDLNNLLPRIARLMIALRDA